MAQNINQFGMSPEVGQVDLFPNWNVISVMVDSTQATPLLPGMPVTCVDSAGGVPKVIGTTSDTAQPFGFIVRNPKDAQYVAGEMMEIAFARGCVMWMQASTAIARNGNVTISGSTTVPTVKLSLTTKMISGRALDKAVNIGDIIRVLIDLPGDLVP